MNKAYNEFIISLHPLWVGWPLNYKMSTVSMTVIKTFPNLPQSLVYLSAILKQ